MTNGHGKLLEGQNPHSGLKAASLRMRKPSPQGRLIDQRTFTAAAPIAICENICV